MELKYLLLYGFVYLIFIVCLAQEIFFGQKYIFKEHYFKFAWYVFYATLVYVSLIFLPI
ncbi:Uncharacterised protein [Listeria newyorkensis]|nr:Uncharacterised protein [Listeria newyorkensis]